MEIEKSGSDVHLYISNDASALLLEIYMNYVVEIWRVCALESAFCEAIVKQFA